MPLSSLPDARAAARLYPKIELMVVYEQLPEGGRVAHLLSRLRDMFSEQMKMLVILDDPSPPIPGEPRIRIARSPIGAEQLLDSLRQLLNTRRGGDEMRWSQP